MTDKTVHRSRDPLVTLPAISVHQPYAFAIAHLQKNVENRTWATSCRGPIAIHATASGIGNSRTSARCATPVPCRGAQRIWRLPEGVDAAVRADLGTETAA